MSCTPLTYHFPSRGLKPSNWLARTLAASVSLTYHFPSRGLKPYLKCFLSPVWWAFDLPLPLTGIETVTAKTTEILLSRLWLTTSPHGDWNSWKFRHLFLLQIFDLPLPLTGIETRHFLQEVTPLTALTYHFPSRGLKQYGVIKPFCSGSALTYHFPSRGLKQNNNVLCIRPIWSLTYHFPSRGLKPIFIIAKTLVKTLTYHFPSRGLKQQL